MFKANYKSNKNVFLMSWRMSLVIAWSSFFKSIYVQMISLTPKVSNNFYNYWNAQFLNPFSCKFVYVYMCIYFRKNIALKLWREFMWHTTVTYFVVTQLYATKQVSLPHMINHCEVCQVKLGRLWWTLLQLYGKSTIVVFNISFCHV